jgi:hypothetical protein
MWTDPIVEETRRWREAHASKFNYDLQAIYSDLKAQEQQSDRKVVSLPPRPPIQIAKHQAVPVMAG